MKYIRRIDSVNHWNESNSLYNSSFSTGDVISHELRTSKNTLSIWKYEKEEEITDLLVAIALSRDSIQKLVYVKMDEEDINTLGIPIESERGVANGLVDENILNKHVNLTKIDFWRLGFITTYICSLVKSENNYGTITRKELFNYIHTYVQDGRIDIENMNDKIRNSYEECLKKSI